MKIIGHRGAKGLAPENTIEGFRAALRYPIDGIEFDVRTTHDGVVVLAHDDNLELADGGELSIKARDYSELLAAWPALCTFKAALRTINRQVPALIEIKPECDVEPVVTRVRRLLVEGWQPTDFTFLSFEFNILKQVHAALPDVPIIVNEEWSSIRAVHRAKQLGTKQVDMLSWWLWPGVIRGLTKRGYQVYCYTLNNPAKAARWQKHGLYGVVSDYPDQMVAIVDQTTLQT